MIWVILMSILFGVSGGNATYYQIMDRNAYKNNAPYQHYNKAWHNWALVRDISGVGLGVTIALDAVDKKSLLIAGSDALLAGAINWTIKDGVYNTKLRRPFYYQSPVTPAITEPYGTWYAKTGTLALALLFRILLEER